jgi:hypothetical protein
VGVNTSIGLWISKLVIFYGNFKKIVFVLQIVIGAKNNNFISGFDKIQIP